MASQDWLRRIIIPYPNLAVAASGYYPEGGLFHTVVLFVVNCSRRQYRQGVLPAKGFLYQPFQQKQSF